VSQVKASVIRWVYSLFIYIMWLDCTLGILNNLTYTYFDNIFGTLQWLNFLMRTSFCVGMFIWQRLGYG
jgi:hypothetical protein